MFSLSLFLAHSQKVQPNLLSKHLCPNLALKSPLNVLRVALNKLVLATKSPLNSLCVALTDLFSHAVVRSFFIKLGAHWEPGIRTPFHALGFHSDFPNMLVQKHQKNTKKWFEINVKKNYFEW